MDEHLDGWGHHSYSHCCLWKAETTASSSPSTLSSPASTAQTIHWWCLFSHSIGFGASESNHFDPLSDRFDRSTECLFQSQTIVRGSTAATQSNNVSPAKNVDEFQSYPSSTLPISRNHHLDRLYNVKTPDPTTDNPFPMLRKPAVPTYQNDLILPSNGKVKPPVAVSPVPVTPREKIDGSTKLSLEDVRWSISTFARLYSARLVCFCLTKSGQSIRSTNDVWTFREDWRRIHSQCVHRIR